MGSQRSALPHRFLFGIVAHTKSAGRHDDRSVGRPTTGRWPTVGGSRLSQTSRPHRLLSRHTFEYCVCIDGRSGPRRHDGRPTQYGAPFNWYCAVRFGVCRDVRIGMALTNYIMHSFLGVAVFYGIGLALIGRSPPSVIYGIAIGIFVLQILLSMIWLSRFKQGPLEWLWRFGTYKGKVQLPP